MGLLQKVIGDIKEPIVSEEFAVFFVFIFFRLGIIFSFPLLGLCLLFKTRTHKESVVVQSGVRL